MKRSQLLLAAALLVAPAGLTLAQGGLKKDLVTQLDEAQTKLVGLANTIPADKFSWRPGAGVRSVSEVLVHVAMENLEIPPLAGMPASATKAAGDAEKTVTSKAAVIDLLTKSFAYAKQSVTAFPDAQMDASASYFGTPMSKRGILLNLAVHGHEHLGQLIAYARMNSIKPPW